MAKATRVSLILTPKEHQLFLHHIAARGSPSFSAWVRMLAYAELKRCGDLPADFDRDAERA